MKTAASLNSTLLSRKGAAAPATFLPAEPRKAASDMGAAPSAPLLPRHEPARGVAKAPRPVPNGRGKPDDAHHGEARTRLTLRLDREQHLKVKLASVHLGQSAQAIMLAALERYLQQVAPTLVGGRCGCLGAGAVDARPAGGSGRPT